MNELAYKFQYSSKEDTVSFVVKMGLQLVCLTLKADAFLELCDNIVASSRPLLEELKKKNGEGIKEDISFDTGTWDDLMNKSEGRKDED